MIFVLVLNAISDVSRDSGVKEEEVDRWDFRCGIIEFLEDRLNVFIVDLILPHVEGELSKGRHLLNSLEDLRDGVL